MRRLILVAFLAAAMLSFLATPAQAQRYGNYGARPVSNVWHPRSSAYVFRPSRTLQPRSFGSYGSYGRAGYGRYDNFNARQIQQYGPRPRLNARPSTRFNARPSTRFNARPSTRFNARPSTRFNARPSL